MQWGCGAQLDKNILKGGGGRYDLIEFAFDWRWSMEPGLQIGGREPWKQYNQLGDYWLIQSGSDGGLSEGRATGTESGGHA